MSSNIRVLIVEDSISNQKVCLAMLEHQGITVDIANNGIEGIKAVADGDYDVVLMDIQLPGMDGIETTQGIRALGGRKAEIPIIALTAKAMVGDRERYLDGGMDDYVSKPVSMVSLTGAILRWCPSEKIAAMHPPPVHIARL